jgi:hypothetical protein
VRTHTPHRLTHAYFAHTRFAGEKLCRSGPSVAPGVNHYGKFDRALRHSLEIGFSPDGELAPAQGARRCETNPKGKKRMIRNLKVLGLALVAVFAMSALTASAASAQSKQGELTTAGIGGVTLTATEVGQNALTAYGGKTECPGSTITAHKITTTPHTFIPNKSTEATLTPHFKNCVTTDASGNHFTTVTMTSCDFHIKIGETTGGVAHTYGAKAGVTCTKAGDTIDVEVYPFSGSELGGIVCTIKVKAQENLTGLHVTTDTATDNITVRGTVIGIHAERSGSGCSTETVVNAEQHINVIANGKDSTGAAVGVTVSDTAV